jgi:hypothetical protein
VPTGEPSEEPTELEGTTEIESLDRGSLGLIGAVGLVSGVLSVLALSNLGLFYSTGFLFGSLIAGYLLVHEGEDEILKLGLFAVLGVVSLHAAVYGGLIAMELAMQLAPSPTEHHHVAFAVAGAVGAFIMLLAALSLFGTQGPSGKALRYALVGSLGGALFGVLGALWEQTVSPNSGGEFGVNGVRGAMLLWQPGVALLLGGMLQYERR